MGKAPITSPQVENATMVVDGPSPPGDGRDAGPRLGPGESVDRYIVLRPLGAGGMGIVHLAFDPELDRRVALKLLRPDRVGREDGSASQLRLLREAQALARLSHPNVVHVYDVGTFENRVYLAMEYVDGDNVDRWMRAGNKPARAILDVLIKAGRGLAAAHRAGLVHLDVKPGNVVVGNDGEVRVLDFGLAREPGTEIEAPTDVGSDGERSSEDAVSSFSLLTSQVTGSSVVMGTPGYVAPELYLKKRAPDARADQFSFAVTAWEVLYDQFPFAGKTREELRKNARKGRLQEPPKNRGVPGHVHQALVRALKPNPTQRFASMDAMLAELERDPARARRRLVVGAAVAIGLGLAAIGYQQALDETQAMCRGADQHLAGVWDPERRAALRTAFENTQAPFASFAADTVTQLLDQHTTAWVGMRTEACEAAKIRGEQSEALMDLRMTCLDRRLEEIHALTDVLVSADAEVVELAIKATADLSTLDECADSEGLRNRPELPDDPDVREQARQIEKLLTRAEVEARAGRVKDAIGTAQQAIDLADALGIPVVRARAYYTIGQFHDEQGEGQKARAELEQALWLAETAGDDTLRSDVFLQLAFVTGRRLANYSQAHWFARASHATLDRVGGETRRRRARLWSIESVIYTEEGKFDEAVAGYERALELYRELKLGEGLDTAATLNNLGSTYTARGDGKSALEYYQRALTLWEKTLGPDHPEVAMVYGNVGNAQQLIGDTDAAIKNLMHSVEIETRAKGTNSPDAAAALNNIGVAYQVAGDLEQAANYYQRAVDSWSAIEVEHPSAAATLSNYAEVLNDLGRHDEALGHALDASTLLDRLFDEDHPYKAFAANSLGEARLGKGEIDDAIPSLQRAIRIFENTDVDDMGLADARFALARALWESDNPRARELISQAREDYASAGKRADKNAAQLDEWARAHP